MGTVFEVKVLPKKYTIKYKDNKIYIGYLNYNLKKEYYGTLFFENNKYQGFFSDDKMNGQGRLIYSKGDYYEGKHINKHNKLF